jgi:L-aminopeptidase/D-esterase-like protein
LIYTRTRMNHVLKPRTSFSSPALEFDFPSLHIGVAEYEEGPTGATVFYFPNGGMAAVDARGGSVASFNTERLRLGYDRPSIYAVCFAGGASYGLEASSGVLAELFARREYRTDWASIPTVCGAVVYDFRNRHSPVYPDKELGRAALRSAVPGHFPLGARGAGRFVHAGKLLGPPYMEQAGQGGAFAQIGETRLAVFTVVNAVGALMDRSGKVVCGNRDPETGARSAFGQDLREGVAERKRSISHSTEPPPGNTTLTLVATNQRMNYRELQRLAIQAHTGMARAIDPFHTEHDGDLLFAVTTAEVDNAHLAAGDLAVWASELAWDAVLASAAPPAEFR